MSKSRLTTSDPIMDVWARAIRGDLDSLVRKVDKVQTTTAVIAETVANDALSGEVTGLSVSENGFTVDGVVYSEVTVTYTAPAVLDTFNGIYAVLQNYRGSSELVKVAEHNYQGSGGGSVSFKFLVNRTGETVTLYAVAKNVNGTTRSDWQNSPSTTVVLDGNVSAPTAPTSLSAAGTALAIFLSWTENSESNVNSYNIYRNTTNSSGTATKIASIPANRTSGTVSYSDNSGLTFNQTYYYWVKAVNTASQESSFSSGVSATAVDVQRAFGTQILPNPGFENNTVGATLNTPQSTVGTYVCDDWYINSNSGYHVAYVEEGVGQQRSGVRSLLLSLRGSVPSDNVYKEIRVSCKTKIPVKQGDYLVLGGWRNWQVSAGFPVGVDGIARLGVIFYDINGVQVTEALNDITGATFPYASVRSGLTVPSGASYCTVQCAIFVRNNSGSTLNGSSQIYQDVRFDDVSLTFLTLSASNAPVNNAVSANIAALSSTAGSTTINIAAFTLQFGFGSVSYGAGSVNPGAFGTYYIYTDDPILQGTAGGATYSYTTSGQTAIAGEGRLYLGKITTSAGSAGVGGVTGCVEVGTPVEFYPDSEVQEEILPCDEWIELPAPGYEPLYMHPETLVSVFKKAKDLALGDFVELKNGNVLKLATKPSFVKRVSHKVKRTVKPWGTYFAKGIRLHNMKALDP